MVIEKASLRDIDLYFIYNPVKPNKSSLNSAIEINFDELFESISELNFPSSCFICEGGYYFNNPDKILKNLSAYKLFYFVLSPSMMKLRQNYLKRHKSKKKIDREGDWIRMNKRFEKQLRENEKLKKVLNSNQFLNFFDEDVEHKFKKIKDIILNTKYPTIFIITGPNASGKSTLLWELMRNLKV